MARLMVRKVNGRTFLYRTNAKGKLNAVPLEQWAKEQNARNRIHID